jgi:serine/threonine protein kinase
MDPTDLTTARAEARVGSLLDGRWRLDRLIGVGGMTAVYAATHRNTKRVAVKILHPEFAVDDNACQMGSGTGWRADRSTIVSAARPTFVPP